MNLKNVKNSLALGVILGIVGVVASGVLAWFYGVTEPAIEAGRIRKTNQALAMVLPAFENDIASNAIEFDGVKFYGALSGGKLIAVAAEAAVQSGYAGEISGLVGLSDSGAVLELKGGRSAVLITGQQETPGLGANVCNRQNVKTFAGILRGEKAEPGVLPGNAVLDSFAGKGVDSLPLQVKKDGGDIEFITGATITSRAVTDLVNKVLETYKAHQGEIIPALSGGVK